MAEIARSHEAPAPRQGAPAVLVTETVGSVVWLAMDAAWMLGWKEAATALVVPCVLAHVSLFAFAERTFVGLAVVGSMVAWVAMNAAWMLGDVWGLPSLLVVARFACAAATVLLVAAFSRSRYRTEAGRLLFAGFRRLRLAALERGDR